MLIQGSYPDITDINQFIDDNKKAVLSLNNFYDNITLEDNNKCKILIPWNDFFLRYRKELEEIEEWHTIPESHFYKPKMVSFEIYGTTELWLALLRVNNMRNITEFHFPIIKVYNAKGLMELINIFFKREKKVT